MRWSQVVQGREGVSEGYRFGVGDGVVGGGFGVGGSFGVGDMQDFVVFMGTEGDDHGLVVMGGRGGDSHVVSALGGRAEVDSLEGFSEGSSSGVGVGGHGGVVSG